MGLIKNGKIVNTKSAIMPPKKYCKLHNVYHTAQLLTPANNGRSIAVNLPILPLFLDVKNLSQHNGMSTYVNAYPNLLY